MKKYLLISLIYIFPLITLSLPQNVFAGSCCPSNCSVSTGLGDCNCAGYHTPYICRNPNPICDTENNSCISEQSLNGTDVSVTQLLNSSNQQTPGLSRITNIGDIFTKGGFDLINIIFIIIGLIFFANLIMVGWEYMLSSGDTKKVQAASTRLTNGLIGLIMAIAAYIIVRLISQVLGLGGTTTSPII